MNKSTILTASLTALLFTAACTTDPFTGEQQISRTAGGAGIGAVAGAALGTLAGGDDRRNGRTGAQVQGETHAVDQPIPLVALGRRFSIAFGSTSTDF